MILSDKIEIRINPSNIHHYKLYYDNIKNNDIILVNFDELTKGSHYKIDIRCDECGDEYVSEYNILFKTNSLETNLCKKCKLKKTLNEKYGVDNIFQLDIIKEKSKLTIQKKYGVNNVSQNSEIKQKKIKTNLKNHGVECVLSSDIIKEKSKLTIQKKYGVDNVSQNNIIKKKKEISCLKNNDVDYIFQQGEFKKNQKKLNLKKLQVKYNNLITVEGDFFIFYCDKCKKEFEIYKKTFYGRYNLNVELCTYCNPVGSCYCSGTEKNIYDFIKVNYQKEIIQNSRNIIKPYELDIYLPDLNLAFEFNGLFWHNENNTNDNYHLNKTELCEKQGIQLIHIWEDDWLYKQDIVKSMILNKIDKSTNSVLAKDCEIKENIDDKLIKDFLNNNHIKGFIDYDINIGLFYNNELVSLMIFDNTSINKYEILRFCNKLNYNIIGGESELFKYFIDKYKTTEIIVYVDRSYSQGKLYEKLGFVIDKKNKPNYSYILDKKRQDKLMFSKDKLVKQGYDNNKTEHEIMLERKIFRIYDCGNLKFVYKK